MQQAIISVKVEQVIWCHMASAGHNELNIYYGFSAMLSI